MYVFHIDTYHWLLVFIDCCLCMSCLLYPPRLADQPTVGVGPRSGTQLHHRWKRNPRPQPQKFSKLVFLIQFSYYYNFLNGVGGSDFIGYCTHSPLPPRGGIRKGVSGRKVASQ